VKKVGVPITTQEEAKEEDELRLFESEGLGVGDGEGDSEGLRGIKGQDRRKKKKGKQTNLYRRKPRHSEPRHSFTEAHRIRCEGIRPNPNVVGVDEDESVDFRFAQRSRSEELELWIALSLMHRPHLRFEEELAQSQTLEEGRMERRREKGEAYQLLVLLTAKRYSMTPTTSRCAGREADDALKLLGGRGHGVEAGEDR
jgi:hypothetical protein